MAQSPRSLNINLDLLASHPEKEWLLNNFYKQLAKDLCCELADIPKEELKEWMYQWLENYTAKGKSLLDLFYRIDLDEKFSKCGNQSIAEGILKREAIKVYFRAQYSGKI
jgi:hypothetical protein